MTVANFIGWCLLASPFVAMFVYAWHTMSFKEACGIYATVSALAGVLWAGVSLVKS